MVDDKAKHFQRPPCPPQSLILSALSLLGGACWRSAETVNRAVDERQQMNASR